MIVPQKIIIGFNGCFSLAKNQNPLNPFNPMINKYILLDNS